jgi:translation initiation factor IF-2
MKVKELAVIFNVGVEELLDLLYNVGVNIDLQEEAMVNKDIEKKLAKRYNVEYPFKTNKTKKPTPNENPVQQQPVKNTGNTQPTQPKKEQPKQEEKEVKQAEVKIIEPVRVMKTIKTEEVKPRVDEDTLAKYADYLEEDEYNIRRENRSKHKDSSDEYGSSAPRRKKNIKNKHVKNAEKRTSNIPTNQADDGEKVIFYEANMTVQEVAEAMKISVTDLVKKLFMSIGVMAGATNSLERDVVELIAMEYGFEVKDKQITDMTRFDEIDIVDNPEDLVERPVIVTIMGHVDHGKTTLLDTIRNSHVTAGEAGGITQHIGAYQVEKDGTLITFIDTPGHAAFTEMRARGAQITDIVILVVASDDGVMPQTREAIEHAQAAGVPIIVAINKMDKPTANPDRIKQELTEFNLLAEEWGGDTIFVPISALKGTGVNELLDMIILVSQMKEYKANPNRLGVGTVIEAKLDKGRGPVATLLVQNGTVKVGDIIVVGNTFGKIRAMQDEKGHLVVSAGPSKPVEITGIAEVPCAGDKFMILDDERKAREIAETRTHIRFNEEMGVGKGVSLNELLKNQSSEELKVLNLIIKCDVQGSIEAIKGLLDKINIEGTKINIISSRVGGITETDINLAIASQAVIIGFNIRPMANISDLAKSKGIEIRLYNIIYKLQEDIEKAVKGLLDPVFEEKETGQAVVRETYKVSRIGTIAGCYVNTGYISRNAGVRLIRNSVVIYTGKISSLKRFKDDAKEVKAGFDCGLTIENFNDIKVDDIIECFVMEEVERD